MDFMRTVTASVTLDDGIYVAQCLEYDVASQGRTEEEALSNLAEALELYLEDDGPPPSKRPRIARVEIQA